MVNLIRFKPRTITCRNYKSYIPSAMNEELKSVDWSPVYDNNDVNSAWLYMKVITGIYDKYAPVFIKRVKGKPAPWLTEELKKLMDERDSLVRKYRRTNNNEDFHAYKIKRNKVNIMLRQAKSSYNKNLLDENSKTPEPFWKIVKSIYPIKSSITRTSQPFEIDGESTTDESRISNGFCSYFTHVVTTLKRKAFPLRDFVWRYPSGFPNRTANMFKFRNVSILEVERHLSSPKRYKSSGNDGLPPRLLKDSATIIAPPLTHIINLSLQHGLIPSEWKSTKIVPIHKSGSKSDFDNYRPISILPSVSKVIEKIVHRQLMKFLNDNRLLSENQFGFRPGRSTELAAIKFSDDIRRIVDQGNMVGAVFIDLTKAFDTISHGRLLSKLPGYGVTGVELDWFKILVQLVCSCLIQWSHIA